MAMKMRYVLAQIWSIQRPDTKQQRVVIIDWRTGLGLWNGPRSQSVVGLMMNIWRYIEPWLVRSRPLRALRARHAQGRDHPRNGHVLIN